MPGPPESVHDGGKAVQGNQRRRLPATMPPTVRQRSSNRVVIRPEDVIKTGFGGGIVQILIARNDNAIADFGNGRRMARGTIAVDHQPRITRQHRWRIQAHRQKPGHFRRPDIPGDVLG